MTIHHLKTWPNAFAAVTAGIKTFEYRKDDRTPPYQRGDTLILEEWDPVKRDYTGEQCTKTVMYITRGQFDVPPGYCIMAIR